MAPRFGSSLSPFSKKIPLKPTMMPDVSLNSPRLPSCGVQLGSSRWITSRPIVSTARVIMRMSTVMLRGSVRAIATFAQCCFEPFKRLCGSGACGSSGSSGPSIVKPGGICGGIALACLLSLLRCVSNEGLTCSSLAPSPFKSLALSFVPGIAPCLLISTSCGELRTRSCLRRISATSLLSRSSRDGLASSPSSSSCLSVPYPSSEIISSFGACLRFLSMSCLPL